MEILQERLFVKGGLGLDELLVNPLKNRVVAKRKGIMQRFFDCKVRIAFG